MKTISWSTECIVDCSGHFAIESVYAEYLKLRFNFIHMYDSKPKGKTTELDWVYPGQTTTYLGTPFVLRSHGRS